MPDRVKNSSFEIADMLVKPGTKATGELPLVKLVTGNQISIPLYIFNGYEPGPVIWISAAIHGDEVAGVEIIRQVIEKINPKKLRGTLITVPIVNVHGFLNRERYLPDRRDLNRSFPGSAKGSLAAGIAHLFMSEIVSRCDMGIDLHTGSNNRANYPQIRSDLDNPESKRLCEVFGAPIMLHSKIRDGSLRGAASERGKKVLLYEGGEANRFDYEAIRYAVNGIMRILADQGMTDTFTEPNEMQSLESRNSSWLRAKKSGIAIMGSELGEFINKGQTMGLIHNSLGKQLGRIIAHSSGLIIGRSMQPLVNQGDALYHIAEVNGE
ncbi:MULTISPECIES: succinylglutamate desuccinylase/aspartoacylase family protein [unclassified Oceanispirochaeta]|uniref:succinylglutamate desuccinylase/aspartoacylase family protein n=1 Tax=unclassified Oceanispirochaeta TaxID=2635722 RepID=UPI000E094773|nr:MULTISPECIES: succinylglutamate desuccinylase/aspartoacylase family protein [unclassified Oceanispirochaeta]MBF9016752.1 succinylglutamate desuccinylase/aspartoacylase family protein [Oceanispirochaeta sp. M2]NPD72022.1 succinylglutamate desuccinylase/aspartoacylase family protein [Oceanispirochaeta sp. M1]RDG32466.1 succinylglutamate desuccinylase [Oceanispirochaeta sp. M1]